MNIEITKKQLIVAVITIGIIALSFTGGYFVGLYQDKNPKGDGSHFFVESRPAINDSANENLVYHSTTDCPEIGYGLQMDRYGFSYEYNKSKIYPYYFCSKCMDSDLIEKCDFLIRSAFKDSQNTDN